ncbi:hypothetical protein [Fischerella thermalis]|uniref:hypothetical protein n=1 Tax=Fischerella thermalis TaxID=372787 RepID=UPI00307E3027
MKILAITTLIALSTLTFASVKSANAQVTSNSSICVSPIIVKGNVTYVSLALTRAKNLARQAAEKVNGGLSKYRAEASMYGPSFEAPCVDDGNNTWTFTFTGSKPGSTTPSVKTIVTVAKDGSEVTVDYNSPISKVN